MSISNGERGHRHQLLCLRDRKFRIKNIAATATGMVNEPGTNVAGKSPLNAESGL